MELENVLAWDFATQKLDFDHEILAALWNQNLPQELKVNSAGFVVLQAAFDVDAVERLLKIDEHQALNRTEKANLAGRLLDVVRLPVIPHVILDCIRRSTLSHANGNGRKRIDPVAVARVQVD